jgi:hypothetical protein
MFVKYFTRTDFSTWMLAPGHIVGEARVSMGAFIADPPQGKLSFGDIETATLEIGRRVAESIQRASDQLRES